ncbi:aminotransferase class IV [Dactylosporangium sp. NPDC051541]|uniref:aminotransferase class IV n=1 Tax=Dactylosporangium sp. NPDC051541 TaxID=3363977 RepID=UPI00379D3706
MELIRVELDGRRPTLDELYQPLLSNYGHFTAMQVRAGRVRGLDLHLTRLLGQTRELFAADLDTVQVRAWLRQALRDVPDASVRVNVYAGPKVMIVVRPPSSPPPSPLRLRSVPYERPAAHLKHVGGFGQVYYGHQAEAEGYDDALLTDRTGAVCESAIANVAFSDGTTVTWPTAPHLPGIEMQLLEPRLPSRRARVALDELKTYRSAFTCNSIGVTAVARIDDVDFTVDGALMAQVADAFAAVPWDLI